MATLGSASSELEKCKTVLFVMPALLHDRSKMARRNNSPMMVDHTKLKWLTELDSDFLDELDEVDCVRPHCHLYTAAKYARTEILRSTQSKSAGLNA
ncbi:MAG: hypothetical protein JSW48_02335, partial [Betaproteobacteria bacterium]